MSLFPEFGPEQRAMLESRAGEIYVAVARAGSVAVDDEVLTQDPESTDLLRDLGLLVEDDGRVVAVDPTLVQTQVVGPLGVRAGELMAESTGWAQAFTGLAQSYRRDRVGEEPVTQIHGLDSINRFLTAAVDDAQTELLTAQPSGARSAATLDVAVQRDLRALRRGLSMRTLYQHSARRSQPTQEYVARVSEHGAQVRTLDEFFNRLIVVDRRLAVVPGAQSTSVAVVVHEPNLVAYLADVFERYWERAREFADRERPTERAVADDVHNMTVRMLAEGHSDQASAKRMGVSTRTYAGYVAALKAEYDAETRFQLGYKMGVRRDGSRPALREGGDRPDDRADQQDPPGPEVAD